MVNNATPSNKRSSNAYVPPYPSSFKFLNGQLFINQSNSSTMTLNCPDTDGLDDGRLLIFNPNAANSEPPVFLRISKQNVTVSDSETLNTNSSENIRLPTGALLNFAASNCHTNCGISTMSVRSH